MLKCKKCQIEYLNGSLGILVMKNEIGGQFWVILDFTTVKSVGCVVGYTNNFEKSQTLPNFLEPLSLAKITFNPGGFSTPLFSKLT